jgi:glucose/arabinose dehydrogenase/outer membrane lipoprotein-sorting protein
MMTEANGGAEALAGMTDQVMSLEMTLHSIEGTLPMTITAKRPNKIRWDIYGPEGMVFSRCYDGTTGWSMENGQRKDLIGPQLEEIESMAATFLDGFLNYQDKGFTLALLADEVVDEQNYIVLQVTDKYDNVQKHYINHETYFIERQSGKVANDANEWEPMVITFKDLKMVDGITFPQHMMQYNATGEMIFESIIKEVEHNTGVDDAYFMTEEMPDFKIDQEILADGFEIPWAIEVISEEDFLFTERMGTLYHYKSGEVKKVTGIPESRTYTVDRPYGGMMDISLHPQFESNQMAYLAYITENYTLSVARFKLYENTAQDLEIIFTSNQFSVGSRIAWQDDTHFFLTFGVGGTPTPDPGPQDLNDPRGKIFRLMSDGRIPEDNPVLPGMSEPSGIWTYGHRDPQGLFYDIDNTILYANEHGPLGGDELNVITKGGNYGWPLFSYGINYDHTKVSDMTEEEAAKITILPMKYWKPNFQLAPSGLIKLKNSNFEDWNGSFLMGALTYQHLVLYNPDTDETEIVLPKAGRVRDVAQLPSGNLVILIDHFSPGMKDIGRIVKLMPKKKE